MSVDGGEQIDGTEGGLYTNGKPTSAAHYVLLE